MLPHPRGVRAGGRGERAAPVCAAGPEAGCPQAIRPAAAGGGRRGPGPYHPGWVRRSGRIGPYAVGRLRRWVRRSEGREPHIHTCRLR